MLRTTNATITRHSCWTKNVTDWAKLEDMNEGMFLPHLVTRQYDIDRFSLITGIRCLVS